MFIMCELNWTPHCHWGVLDAITENSMITKFEGFIPNPLDVNMDELNRFVVEHSLMVDLDLKGYRLTADDAINFIRQMKSTKRIGFHAKDRSEHDRIMNELNNEWKSIVNGIYIELSR